MAKKKGRPAPLDPPVIATYFTEKDVKKKMDLMFIHMLEGLSKLMAHSGDFECKGYGGIDPKEALFHCRACICNGIRGHIDQAIERLEERCQE